MIVFATVSREEFVGWLGGSFTPKQKPAKAGSTLPQISGTDLLLLWEQESASTLEATIAVEERNLDNFLAFVATYVGTFVPFTAFFRVMPHHIAQKLLQTTICSHSRIPSALVGVMIAEASSRLRDRIRAPEDLSILACRATLSSAIFSALKAGFEPKEISEIRVNWARARRFFAGEPAELEVDSISNFWLTVGRALLGQDKTPVDDFIRSYITSRKLDDKLFARLVPDLPDGMRIEAISRAPREDQVRSLDRTIWLLSQMGDVDLHVREMVAGALISTVSQGSFRYTELAQSIERLPAANLWFGLFASLHEHSDVFTIGDSLGRHLARPFRRWESCFTPPTADIAIAELEMYGAAWERLRTKSPNVVSVELFPGVCGQFAISSSRSERGEGRQLPSEQLSEVRFLLQQAGRLIEKLDRRDGPIQAGLFQEGYTRSRPSSRKGKNQP